MSKYIKIISLSVTVYIVLYIVTKPDSHDNNVNHKRSARKVNVIDNIEASKNNVHRSLPHKDFKIVKSKNAATKIDVYNEKSKSSNSSSEYHNSSPTTFITVDKFDIRIIRELIKEPSITTLEISLKLGILFSMAHKKRRLIESQVWQKKYFLDFKKLGLDFRFVDVFANIQEEDKVDDCIKRLYTTSFAKNIIKVMRVKGWVDGICIKTLFQDPEDLFFLMDKLKAYPFVSNVHFSEEVEVLGDNTLNLILNLLRRDR